MARKRISTGRVVTVSFLVDLLDIVSNLVIAILTGSAVVFAEMAQGAADSVGSLLLLVGYRRSRRPSDESHPLGYAREVFFWALLSSMVMLVLGGGLTLFRAYRQLVAPDVLDRPYLALAVTLLSVTTNGFALSQSARKLRPATGSIVRGVLHGFRTSTRQLVKTALLRDLLGTLSAVSGLVAISLYLFLEGEPVILDALGAALIGVLMLVFSVALIAEARGFIAGRAVSGKDRRELLDAVRSVPGVESVNELVAVVSGSDRILVELDLELSDELATPEIEGVLDAVQGAVVRTNPAVRHVTVDLNPAGSA